MTVMPLLIALTSQIAYFPCTMRHRRISKGGGVWKRQGGLPVTQIRVEGNGILEHVGHAATGPVGIGAATVASHQGCIPFANRLVEGSGALEHHVM
jgi:hypothetical protein